MNCLVTKLKASVNIEDALVLGAIRLKYNKAGDSPVTIGGFSAMQEKTITLTWEDDENYFCKSSTDPTFDSKSATLGSNSDSNIWCVIKKDGYLRIESKYAVDHIWSTGEDQSRQNNMDIKHLTGTNMSSLRLRNAHGDITYIDLGQNITQLYLSNCPLITGDISSIAKLTSLTDLDIGGYIDVVGNIETLYPLINLTDANITTSHSVTGWKELKGDVKTLADKMYQAGRRSGTLELWTSGNDSALTYNGQPFQYRCWRITFNVNGHEDVNSAS